MRSFVGLMLHDRFAILQIQTAKKKIGQRGIKWSCSLALELQKRMVIQTVMLFCLWPVKIAQSCGWKNCHSFWLTSPKSDPVFRRHCKAWHAFSLVWWFLVFGWRNARMCFSSISEDLLTACKGGPFYIHQCLFPLNLAPYKFITQGRESQLRHVNKCSPTVI